MSLQKVMSQQVLSIFPKASAADAARVMREGHVGDLVVVESRDARIVPVGMLTDRDVVMATVAVGVDPQDVYVKDIMSEGVVVARFGDSLHRVIDLMKKHGIRRVPIVGADGDLVGIVAVEDVLKLLAEELTALSRISERQQRTEMLRRSG
jgi:CBS domain-containing protein